MITFEEALSIINRIKVQSAPEKVRIEQAVGRVLINDVFSDVEMPPFNKAAVDGYACRLSDLPGPLEVIEIIRAGVFPARVITSGVCSKIMTGAMVPEGADVIVMVEYTRTNQEGKVLFIRDKTSVNIAYKAEDVKTGQRVLRQGTRIKPQHIAMLAAVGVVEPKVCKAPVIGIISTGDELVEPDQRPGISQIRNSNAQQLMAQARQLGLESIYLGIASDTLESLGNLIQKGFAQSDILLLTGGVSMGDFDYVPTVLKEIGVEVLFDSIAVQPGKPTIFGRKGNKFLFGLPGNPVSSFVQFELLVKQLVFRMMGNEYKPAIIRLPMAKDFSRRKGERKSFIPVNITDEGKIEPLEYHGSAHIHAYEGATGIMAVEIGETHIAVGTLKDVRQL